MEKSEYGKMTTRKEELREKGWRHRIQQYEGKAVVKERKEGRVKDEHDKSEGHRGR